MATLQHQHTLSNNPLFRKTPWPGITAVICMSLSLVASAVVIAVSDGDPVSSWKVQPAVLLAIFSATSNIVFNTALATGIAVRFWLCASKGVKLSQLHYIWDHGRILGIGSAVRAGPPARTVAVLALLANMLQFVGAPLLQRSTYQALQYRVSNESLSMDIASAIPDGWFGSKDAVGRISNFDRTALPLIQQWWQNTSVTTHHGCEGTCEGYVPGAGFKFECWTTERKLELATNRTDGEAVFFVNPVVAKNATGGPYLRLTVLYVSEVDDSCVGTVREETCDIESATVNYPVTIDTHTVHMRPYELVQKPSAPSRPVDVAANQSAVSPVEALWAFAQHRITDNATKTYEYESDTSTYYGPDMLADIFYVADIGEDGGPKSRCRLKWNRPTEYVLASMYDFMFRAAMRIGNGTETQVFDTRQTVPTLVFQTDGRYLGVGLAVMACGLGVIAMLMWGWWQLERPVTLSPLETASAMGAPIFEETERGATINEILAKVRNIEFRLGTPRVDTSVTEVGKG